MKILAATFVYNEREHIPYWVEYYKSQGCDLFVLDNASDDGTWEWLEENNIPCASFDTNGSFHLHRLQDELLKYIERINPDWVCYCGADLYFAMGRKISEVIEEVDAKGYNQISLKCVNVVSTGEKHGIPLQKHYFRGGYYRDLTMIAKYGKGFQIRNDNIGLDEGRVVKVPGVMVNYGGCKTWKQQEAKLKRRQKAWAEGLPENIGKHFRKNKKTGWITPVTKTKNIRMLPEWAFIKNI